MSSKFSAVGALFTLDPASPSFPKNRVPVPRAGAVTVVGAVAWVRSNVRSLSGLDVWFVTARGRRVYCLDSDAGGFVGVDGVPYGPAVWP